MYSVKSFSFRSWKVWTTIVQEEVFVRMLSFPPLWKSRGRCEEIVVGRAAELWRLAKEVEGRHLRLLGLAVRLHDLRLLTSRAHESAVRRAEQNRTAFASASSSSLSLKSLDLLQCYSRGRPSNFSKPKKATPKPIEALWPKIYCKSPYNSKKYFYFTRRDFRKEMHFE